MLAVPIETTPVLRVIAKEAALATPASLHRWIEKSDPAEAPVSALLVQDSTQRFAPPDVNVIDRCCPELLVSTNPTLLVVVMARINPPTSSG